jgi:nanoRNase/pAp phosphatase (c-di-AMP/oligoRNAs hydrolase)
VTPVALQYGGGGHPRAAGCTVSGELGNVREGVLAAIETALQKQQSTST